MFESNYHYDGTNKKVTVYDVTYDRSGFPTFLIYDGKQWVRRSAKYFSPIGIPQDDDCIEKEIALIDKNTNFREHSECAKKFNCRCATCKHDAVSQEGSCCVLHGHMMIKCDELCPDYEPEDE